MEEKDLNIRQMESIIEGDQYNEEIEVEQEDTESLLMEKPFDPTKINIETKTPSLDTLIKRIDRNNIQMNTETYFQRKDDLWDKTKQSRLIESIMIRFPLPAFFFDASDDNNWLVVDGLQRLSSIRNFCVPKNEKQRLRLTNLEFLTHLNNTSFDELPEDLQRLIEESQVVIYKIMPGTPTDVKFNIFKRINTGGLILEAQEIRHALFQGKPAKFIAKLAKNEAFLEATQHKIKTHRMLDRDFVNRFLGFYLFGYEDYSPDLDTFMSKAMAEIEQKNDKELHKIEEDFSNSMKLAKAVFEKKAFRKIYKNHNILPRINKALFDAISTQFSLLSEEERRQLKIKAKPFRKALKNALATDQELFTAVSSSTGDRKRVYKRHDTIKNLIQDTINNTL